MSHFPQHNPLVITGSPPTVVPLAVAFIAPQRQWCSGLATGGLR